MYSKQKMTPALRQLINDAVESAPLTESEEKTVRFHARCSMRRGRTLDLILRGIYRNHGFRTAVRDTALDECANFQP